MVEVVEIVIDRDVLDELYKQGKYTDFLKYWLNETRIKAFIVRKSWDDFKAYWVEKLRGEDEGIVAAFCAINRGIVTPYQGDGGEGQLDDVISETINIVNRHHVTVRYLIVLNTEQYRNRGILIGDEVIVTPVGFFRRLETQEDVIVERFLEIFNDK